MSFFYSESKPKLPLRGCKKLPIRGKRRPRQQWLRQFEVGHIYTFPEFWRLNMPDDLLMEETKHDQHRYC